KTTRITHYDDYTDKRYTKPSFNIYVAEFMLMLSALMYEREHMDLPTKKDDRPWADQNISKIVGDENKEEMEKENENKTHDQNAYKWDDSISYIVDKANNWGLRFY